jgi:hypothetical protein
MLGSEGYPINRTELWDNSSSHVVTGMFQYLRCAHKEPRQLRAGQDCNVQRADPSTETRARSANLT